VEVTHRKGGLIIKELWLQDSVKIMRNFGCKQDIWEEFLIWSVYRSGWDTNRPYTARCKNKDAEHSYRCLYQIIKNAVEENPHRNVLLKLMAAIGLASPDDGYDEQAADKLLAERTDRFCGDRYLKLNQGKILQVPAAFDCMQPEDYSKFLNIWAVQSYIIHDSICDHHGSKLIAMANAIKNRYELSYPDQAVLIASNKGTCLTASGMMAFIQMSMMGMACYVLLDNAYGICDKNRMALFAPPNAVCSKQFFSDAWNNARTATMLWGMTYGIN